MKFRTYFLTATALVSLLVPCWAEPNRVHLELNVSAYPGHPLNKEGCEKLQRVLQSRLDPGHDKHLMLTQQGAARLRLDVDSEQPEEVRRTVITPGHLEFKEEIYNAKSKTSTWKAACDGSEISSAIAAQVPGGGGRWEVQFELSPHGKEAFTGLTRRLVGKRLGIFLDGKAISKPFVQSPIEGGFGVITGLNGAGEKVTSEREARLLAQWLNSGPLPLRVTVEKSR